MSSEIQWAKVVAWFAVVLCVAISARGATVYAKNSPRVFTVLALFSLNWALLIPYYSQSNPSELLASFAGFLLVYIGVLLRREARNPLTTDSQKADESEQITPIEISKIESSVARGDRIALWLLGLLIAPSLISLPFASSNIKFLNRLYTEPILGSVVTLIGYYSIWSAIRIYSSRKKLIWAMFAVLVVYTIIEITFTTKLVVTLSQKGDLTSVSNTADSIDFWSKPPEIMDETFLYSFAILKILFVALFIYIVLYESVSEEDRKLSITDKILKLFGIL